MEDVYYDILVCLLQFMLYAYFMHNPTGLGILKNLL